MDLLLRGETDDGDAGNDRFSSRRLPFCSKYVLGDTAAASILLCCTVCATWDALTLSNVLLRSEDCSGTGAATGGDDGVASMEEGKDEDEDEEEDALLFPNASGMANTLLTLALNVRIKIDKSVLASLIALQVMRVTQRRL